MAVPGASPIALQSSSVAGISSVQHVTAAAGVPNTATGAPTAPASGADASNELLILRDDIERNKATIAQLKHQLAAGAAQDQAMVAANHAHLHELQSELATVLAVVQRLGREHTGATVPRATFDSAAAILACKEDELASVRRDVHVLEEAFRRHLDDPRLHLKEQCQATQPALLATFYQSSSGAANGSANAAAAMAPA